MAPGHARRGLSDGVVSDVAREGRRRANRSTAAPYGSHAVQRQPARAKVNEGGSVDAT